MSRTLQWVLGISAALIALAIVFAMVLPWIAAWLGWQGGYGMMGGFGGGRGGMMGGYGPSQAPSPSAGGYGMMNGYGRLGGGYGMMPWAGSRGASGTADRLTVEQALTAAEDYAAAIGGDLAVAEVMEFENNLYALVVEAGAGRAALELLIDPYTGAVGPEPGPNMMWNDKYGHMSFGDGGENRLPMDEARAFAQQALDAQFPGSKVHEDGASFYGYYTFDFDGSDGTIAGMLSVEGSTGAVWLHTWHGGFISEWESEEMSS
jgi:hypothetical protein